MDSPHLVGARIRTIRKRRSLTQEDLAARIGRSVNSVSALERGLSKPAFDTLVRLASALEVPVRDFFAPVAEAESPEHAALQGELLDVAQALPLAELALTVRIAGLVGRWRAGRDGRGPAAGERGADG